MLRRCACLHRSRYVFTEGLWNLLGPWCLSGGLWQRVGQGLLVGEEQLGHFLGRGWLREVGARLLSGGRMPTPRPNHGRFKITGQPLNSVGIMKHLGKSDTFVILFVYSLLDFRPVSLEILHCSSWLRGRTGHVSAG